MTKLTVSCQPTTLVPAYAEATCRVRTYLELAALDSAVPCARGHARSVACEWGLSDLADEVELLVSELVTNAVKASRHLRTQQLPVVRLWLSCGQFSVSIHVWDGSDEMPVRRDAGAEDVSGRGLLLVDALSTGWGCYRAEGGKITWAEIGW
jgi:anti-sigma regulatory factor (Ser/Thr protein kinase)